MTENSTRHRAVSEAARRALQPGATIIVPSAPGDECLARSRGTTLELAREYDLAVVVYDRSEETWMDHPHPEGPLRADELGEGREELRRTLDDFANADVDATAYISTVPSMTEIIGAIQSVDADLVLLPSEFCKPSLADRLTAHDGTVADVVAAIAHNIERPVTVLVDDGESVDVFRDGLRDD